MEIKELVRQTVDDHRSISQEHELEITVRLTPEPVFVHADRSRMAQILGNLLQNAIKFTPRGGRVCVAVSADPVASRALVRVSDTGIGMKPETLACLFQPFVQADRSLDRSKGGLGLGLALVKGLVELHGGEVTVTSRGIGQGTEVMVYLPLAVSDAVLPPAVSAAPRSRSRRVLIIEDNVDTASSLRTVLSLDGHEVSVAHNGPDGLASARKLRPEVLLCDIGLPGMDGYGVARAFRSDPVLAQTFLIALTGYGLPEDIQRTVEAGFDRHLTKPPTAEQLGRVLASVPDPMPA